MNDAPIFKASKKRKFARRREHHDDERGMNEAVASDLDLAPKIDDTPSESINVADLLKLRNKHNKLRGGVQFSNTQATRDDGSNSAMVLAQADEEENVLKDISSRFTGGTGQVVDVDKHMMAYIDSELAKRRGSMAQLNPDNESQFDSDEESGEEDNNQASGIGTPNTKQSTKPTTYQSQNPLSEFDLGPSAHSTNLARTTLALTHAQSGLPLPSEDKTRKLRRPRKPRLGRDGKPLRPRPRKRRDSSDIARDALVDQVLQEHRLETVYASSTVNTSSQNQPKDLVNNNDEDADERLAEQFRQDFMDAMAERQQRNQNATKAKPNKGAEVVAQGPKMGGGRSARARIQAMQQQQQTGDKKK